MKIIELSKRIHEQHKQWWIDLNTGERKERNVGEIIALVHSEISEAYEGEINLDKKYDDHLPNRLMAEVEMADAAIRVLDWVGGMDMQDKIAMFYNHEELAYEAQTLDKGKKIEMIADLHHRCSLWLENARKNKITDLFISNLLAGIENYCILCGYKLSEAIEEKLEYNKQRADHKLENRKADEGKKF